MSDANKVTKFATEAHANEQFNAMVLLDADFKEFAEDWVTVKDMAEEYLLQVMNINPYKTPLWWTEDLMPQMKAALMKAYTKSEPEKEAEPSATFTVTLIRNNRTITAYEYAGQEEAVEWACIVFKQNTGQETKKFLENIMPAEADWWSITAVDSSKKVSVQLTKGLTAVLT